MNACIQVERPRVIRILILSAKRDSQVSQSLVRPVAVYVVEKARNICTWLLVSTTLNSSLSIVQKYTKTQETHRLLASR